MHNHCDETENISVNPKIEANYKNKFADIMRDFYFRPKRPETSKVRMEAALVLKDNTSVQFGPRRLGFADKEKVQEILNDLLKRGVIRTSASKYVSPIPEWKFCLGCSWGQVNCLLYFRPKLGRPSWLNFGLSRFSPRL